MYKDVSTGDGLIHLVRVQIVGYDYPFIGLPLVTQAPTVMFNTINAVMRQP